MFNPSFHQRHAETQKQSLPKTTSAILSVGCHRSNLNGFGWVDLLFITLRLTRWPLTWKMAAADNVFGSTLFCVVCVVFSHKVSWV